MDRVQLQDLIDQADSVEHHNPENAEEVVARWYNIVENSEQLLSEDESHLDDNLMIRARLSGMLCSNHRDEEAQKCDTETWMRLDKFRHQLQEETYTLLKQNIHDRWKEHYTYDEERQVYEKHVQPADREDQQNKKPEPPPPRVNKHSVPVTTPIRSRSSVKRRSAGASGSDKPPSPWKSRPTRGAQPLSPPPSKPRHLSDSAIPSEQVSQIVASPPPPGPQSPASVIDPQIITKPSDDPSVPQIGTADPWKPPKRSNSVADLHIEHANHHEIQTRGSIDDATIARKQPRPSQSLANSPALSLDSSLADNWIKNLKDQTHNFLAGKNSIYQKPKENGRPYPRVKIAIFDTGIALRTAPEKRAFHSTKHRIIRTKSFLHDETGADGNTDDSGHGTAIASLLLKICPNAEIYIARVARGLNLDRPLGRSPRPAEVERSALILALEEAVVEWKVDIINMSFGWSLINHEVEEALSRARSAKVLLFASTSNYGIGPMNDIMYPARSQHVIAVDAADGLGNPAKFNPASELNIGDLRFTALGIQLNCILPEVGEQRLSGTSFASPIAAGSAALVLEFARQPPLAFDPRIGDLLKQREVMLLILIKMSKPKDKTSFRFLSPNLLLIGDPRDKYGGSILPGGKRCNVAHSIVISLDEEYEGDYGKKMYTELSKIWKSEVEKPEVETRNANIGLRR